MKISKVLAALVLVAACTSCVPLASIYPLWNAETAVELPGLEGTWNDPDGGVLSIEKASVHCYSVTYRGDKEVSRYDVHVVNLNGKLFLDFFPDAEVLEKHLDVKGEAYLPLVPAHFFARITLTGDSLRLGTLDDEQAAKKVDAGQTAVPLYRSEHGIVLTAETKAIQAFVLQFADDAELWGDFTTLTRKK